VPDHTGDQRLVNCQAGDEYVVLTFFFCAGLRVSKILYNELVEACRRITFDLIGGCRPAKSPKHIEWIPRNLALIIRVRGTLRN
jgi:hypothetical protein